MQSSTRSARSTRTSSSCSPRATWSRSTAGSTTVMHSNCSEVACNAERSRTADARRRPMTGSVSSASADRGVSAATKRLTLVATILGSSIAILDASVVSVALPSIQRSLGGGLAGQQWISNAYLLTLGSFILLGGSLGDIFGERRGFAPGGGGFCGASLALSLP